MSHRRRGPRLGGVAPEEASAFAEAEDDADYLVETEDASPMHATTEMMHESGAHASGHREYSSETKSEAESIADRSSAISDEVMASAARRGSSPEHIRQQSSLAIRLLRPGTFVSTTSKDPSKAMAVVVTGSGAHIAVEYANGESATLAQSDIVHELEPEKVLRRVAQMQLTLHNTIDSMQKTNDENESLKKELKKAKSKLSQKAADSDMSKTQMRKKISELTKSNDRLQKVVKTLEKDKKALQSRTPSSKRLVKELNNARKESTRLRKEVDSAQKQADALKLRLEQAKRHRAGGAGVSAKDYDKVKKESVSLKKKMGKLRQVKIQLEKENARLHKQVDARRAGYGRRDRKKSMTEALLKQKTILAAKEERIRTQLEDARRRERELELETKRLQAKAHGLERGRKRDGLERAKKADADRRRAKRDAKAAEHERDRLLGQRKEMSARMARLEKAAADSRRRKGREVDSKKMHIRRHERRGARQKVLVHHKTRVKEYWNTVEKLRGKFERGERLAVLREKIAALQKRMRKMEPQMKDSRKPVADAQMHEYLDAEEEMEQIEDAIDALCLELHSEGADIGELKLAHELETQEKEQLIDELRGEIEDMKQALDDSRSATTTPVPPFADDLAEDRLADAFADMKMQLAHGGSDDGDLWEELKKLIAQVSERMDEAELRTGPKLPKDPSTEQLDREVQAFVNAVNEMSIEAQVSDRALTDAFEQCSRLEEATNEHLDAVRSEEAKAKEIDKEWDTLNDLLDNCRAIVDVVSTSPHSDDFAEEEKELAEMESRYEKTHRENAEMRRELKDEERHTRDFGQAFEDARNTLFRRALELSQAKVAQLKAAPPLSADKSGGFGIKPDTERLRTLKERLQVLAEDVSGDSGKLEKLRPLWDELSETRLQLADAVKEVGEYLYSFKRRPHRKLMAQMKAMNRKVSALCDAVNAKDKELGALFALSDERLFDEAELRSELAAQRALCDYWLKCQPRTEVEMVSGSGEVRTEAEEIRRELEDCGTLLQEVSRRIEANVTEARRQQDNAMAALTDIVATKDSVVQEMEKQLPDAISADAFENGEMRQLRAERKRLCNSRIAKDLAGLAVYDSAQTVQSALQKVQSILGAASPLHYHVVAEYLRPKLIKVKEEIEKLREAMAEMKTAKQNFYGGKWERVPMHLEAEKYVCQFACDIAADYSYQTPVEVFDFDLRLCDAKVQEFKRLEEMMDAVEELKHLKQMYQSFLDDSLAQPLPLTEDAEAPGGRLTVAPKHMYETGDARALAGLSIRTDKRDLEATVDKLERSAQTLRAVVFSRGFNTLYQDSITWQPFAGDDDIGSVVRDGELAIGSEAMEETRATMATLPLFEAMDRNERSQVIAELGNLEWEYSQLLSQKEDDWTQAELCGSSAEYYRRLFREPLDDPWLESDRQNLWGSAMLGQMRRVFNHSLAEDRDALVDAYRIAHTHICKHGGDDCELVEAMRAIHAVDDDSDAPDFGQMQSARMLIARAADGGEESTAAADDGDFEEVRRVLRQYDKDDDLEVPALVEELCRDNDRFGTEYQQLRKEHDFAAEKARKYKLQRDEMFREKEELKGQLKDVYSQLEEDNGGDELSALDVLQQCYQNLEQLQAGVESAPPHEDVKRKTRHALAEMRGPLSDLAEELDSDDLRQAHHYLACGVDDVKRMPSDGLSSERGPLLDVIADLMQDMDSMIARQPASRMRDTRTRTPGEALQPATGGDTEMDMAFPAPIESMETAPGEMGSIRSRHKKGRAAPGREQSPDSPYSRKKHTHKFKFDRDFAMVERIAIEGPWINRYPVAEMVYNGQKFRRKLKYFKWLSRMLVLNVSLDEHVPDLGPDMPESHWPETYLKRRKKELNLFLMQCDATPWIREHEAFQLFVDHGVVSMQKATRVLDKKLIAEYKASRKL